MKTLALLLAASALTLSAPAQAQHQGHTMPMPKPAKKAPATKAPAKKPVAKKASTAKSAEKKAAAKKPAAKQPAAKRPSAPKPVDPHAGHDMSTMDMAPDPHAGHVMPEAQTTTDPHAGHDVSAMEPAVDPHAGHLMPAEAVEIPLAPPPPEAGTGPANAADTIYDPVAQARSRRDLAKGHGGMIATRFVADRAEVRWKEGREGYVLDSDFWVGSDKDKLWLKGEIEGDFGRAPETAEVQALWSHAIAPFFDLQTGIRHDPVKGPDRTHLVLGVMGIAPYWFEIDAAAFLSSKGELTARFEGEYDLRITNRLILQPRVELNLAAQNVPEREIGAGLSSAEAGLRLRYEVTPLFAPYVGVEFERAFGRTADYRRREGEDSGGIAALTGIRFSF